MLENYTCSFCSEEPPTVACICDGDINLIGARCKKLHSSNRSAVHEPIDILLAIKLQSNAGSYEEYLERTMKVSEVMTRLKIINSRAKSCKSQLESTKARLMKELDHIFSEAISNYDPILEELKEKMRIVTQYKQNLCGEGKELINKYVNQGEAGLMSGFIEKIEVPIDDIVEMMKERLSSWYNLNKKIKKEEENPDESKEAAHDNIEMNQKNTPIKKYDVPSLNMKDEQATKNKKISKFEDDYNKYFKEYIDKRKELCNSRIESEARICQIHPKRSRLPTLKTQKKKEILPNSSINLPLSNNLPFKKQFIHTQNIKGNNFIQYDIPNNKMSYIQVEGLRNEPDYVISQISQDVLFIIGFINHSLCEAFLYQISSRTLQKLENLPRARHSASLCCHNFKVYVFGGIRQRAPVRCADYYDLEKACWNKLHDMNYARDSLSSAIFGNMIYLFSGKNSDIDAFSINSQEFRVKSFDNRERFDSIFGVASVFDGKIYLISHSYIQIYDKDLTRLFCKPLEYQQDHYTYYNIVNYDGKVYYYNTINQAIESINTDVSSISIKQGLGEPDPFAQLYRINDKTKEIHKIDVNHSTLEVLNIDISRCFKCTNLCILPEGNLFIVGFCKPVSGVGYIYDPISNIIEKIPDLNTPRGFIGLVYCDESVYAFGGIDKDDEILVAAERFDMRDREWYSIKNMSVARSLPQCIEVNNRIYIMGGKDHSIEYYDPIRNYYKILYDLELIDKNGVASCIDNKIYYVGKSSYQIFSRDFNEIQREENKWNDPKLKYCLGNSVVHRDKIYYFNQAFETLETFDIRSLNKGIFTIKIT